MEKIKIYYSIDNRPQVFAAGRPDGPHKPRVMGRLIRDRLAKEPIANDTTISIWSSKWKVPLIGTYVNVMEGLKSEGLEALLKQVNALVSFGRVK